MNITSHKFVSENNCGWEQTYIEAKYYYVPCPDKTRDGYVWICGSYGEYNKDSNTRLLSSDIYFPTFNNLNGAEHCYISLYYSSYVTVLPEPSTSSLVFSLSKDGGQTWTNVHTAHNTSDIPYPVPWAKLLINAYDYFNSFDSLMLRVRFNGEQGKLAEQFLSSIAQVICIDDLNILVAKNYNSIEDLTAIINAQLSPNSAQTEAILSLDLVTSGYLRVTLNDLLGKKLQEIYNGFEAAGNFTKTFPINNLPKDVYYINIFSNSEVVAKKLVVN